MAFTVCMCLMAVGKASQLDSSYKEQQRSCIMDDHLSEVMFVIVGDINISCFLPLLAHLLPVCGPSSETPKTETSWEPRACWSTSMHLIPDMFLSL